MWLSHQARKLIGPRLHTAHSDQSANLWSSEEHAFSDMVCTRHNSTKSHAWKDVCIVALSRIDHLSIHYHRIKRTSTCEYGTTLATQKYWENSNTFYFYLSNLFSKCSYFHLSKKSPVTCTFTKVLDFITSCNIDSGQCSYVINVGTRNIANSLLPIYRIRMVRRMPSPKMAIPNTGY